MVFESMGKKSLTSFQENIYAGSASEQNQFRNNNTSSPFINCQPAQKILQTRNSNQNQSSPQHVQNLSPVLMVNRAGNPDDNNVLYSQDNANTFGERVSTVRREGLAQIND
jgi:hypothetical protein